MEKRIAGSWAGFVVAGMLALGAAAAGEASPPEPAREIRAIWIHGKTVRDRGVKAVADDLARHHINTALLLVKGINGSVAWNSRTALEKGGTDTLAAFAAACRERGIAVHAWFVVNSDHAWLKKHPDDAFYHCGSRANPKIHRIDIAEHPRVCPLSEGYRAYLLQLIRETATQPDRYPVAGIHLDYIRYPHLVYCFCPRHQAKAKELGIDLDKVIDAVRKTYHVEPQTEHYFKTYKAGRDRDVKRWVEMRAAEIEDIVKDIRDLLDAEAPAMQLSAAFMPEGGEADATFAACHYAQDYKALGRYMEFVCPMTYHREFKKPVTWPAAIAARAAKDTGTTVLTGFGDIGDARAVIDESRRRGLPGFVFFRYGTIKPDQWAGFDQANPSARPPVEGLLAPSRRNAPARD